MAELPPIFPPILENESIHQLVEADIKGFFDNVDQEQLFASGYIVGKVDKIVGYFSIKFLFSIV